MSASKSLFSWVLTSLLVCFIVLGVMAARRARADSATIAKLESTLAERTRTIEELRISDEVKETLIVELQEAVVEAEDFAEQLGDDNQELAAVNAEFERILGKDE